MTPSVVILRAINIGAGHELANYDVSDFTHFYIALAHYHKMHSFIHLCEFC